MNAQRERTFEKICNAQAAITRQLHSHGKADFRRVRKWVNIRNKWLRAFKRI
jgi:hypothetical protein